MLLENISQATRSFANTKNSCKRTKDSIITMIPNEKKNTEFASPVGVAPSRRTSRPRFWTMFSAVVAVAGRDSDRKELTARKPMVVRVRVDTQAHNIIIL